MTDSIIKETNDIMKEHDARMNRISIEQERTSKMIKELQKNIGGIENSAGEIVEEYFVNSLSKKMEINGVKYNILHTNMNGIKGDLEDEFDIVLTNGKQLLIIEVKKNAKENDIEKLIRKIKNFPKLFPYYKHLKIEGALASFKINKNLKKKIIEKNLIAIQRSGNIIVSSS